MLKFSRGGAIRKIFLGLSLLALVSCTKGGSLTGGSSSNNSFSGSLSGSVSGGLSPVSGASVSVFASGSTTALATATTNSAGQYSLTFANPGGSTLLYLQASGGNAGGGTNSNIQLLNVLGPASQTPANANINELTTAVAAEVLKNFNVFKDSNGTVSFATASSATAANALLQMQNIMTGSLALNTGNSSLSSTSQNAINSIANALVSCVETPSKCSTLFSTAANSSGGASISMFDSIFNMMTQASNSTPIYNLGFPIASSTGFTQNSIPTFLTIPMPSSINNFQVGTRPQGIAFDASGNIWVPNQNSNNVTKLSSAGTLLGTFSGFNSPQNAAIDLNGNVWISNCGANNVIEVNPAGAVQGTFSTGACPTGIAIDANGNVWTANDSANPDTITELNSSGALIGTFTVGSGAGCCANAVAIDSNGNPWVSVNNAANNITKMNSSGITVGVFTNSNITTARYLAFDPSGNVWVAQDSGTVVELNSAGTFVGAFTPATSGFGIAIDSAGNIWADNAASSGTVSELNSAGRTIGTYNVGTTPRFVAIDASGNVWVGNQAASGANVNSVSEIVGVTLGPEFFPYSGPQFP